MLTGQITQESFQEPPLTGLPIGHQCPGKILGGGAQGFHKTVPGDYSLLSNHVKYPKKRSL